MSAEGVNVDKPQVYTILRRQLLLPALILSSFLRFTVIVLNGTLLVDIASSLGVSIGTVSQFGVIASLMILTIGLAMGALTIRFKHKSLFLFGVAIYGIGVLVFFFALDFATALLSQAFMGTGSAMMIIMIYSFIGELLSLEKRGWAVGLVSSTQFLAFIFAAPLSGFIASVAGWRSVLLWFIFPLSIACLTFGFLVIPSRKLRQEQSPPKSEYLKAFRQIFSKQSAVACLVGTTLLWVFNAVTFYAVSFYRVQFSVLPETGAMFSAIAAAGGLFGAVGGGRLINWCGRKPLTVVAAFVGGIFAILFTFMPNVWVSVAFWVASASSAAIMGAALNSLVLEQVPEFRASMMSANMTFWGIGSILGMTIGGLVLNLYANNFQLLMTIFGVSAIAAASVVLLLAKDPCKPNCQSL